MKNFDTAAHLDNVQRVFIFVDFRQLLEKLLIFEGPHEKVEPLPAHARSKALQTKTETVAL
jgi:hypothetical protein